MLLFYFKSWHLSLFAHHLCYLLYFVLCLLPLFLISYTVIHPSHLFIVYNLAYIVGYIYHYQNHK
jgi:hypothetical protein